MRRKTSQNIEQAEQEDKLPGIENLHEHKENKNPPSIGSGTIQK